MGRNEFVNAMFQNIRPSNGKNVDVFLLNWNDYLKERVTNEYVKFYNHFGQNKFRYWFRRFRNGAKSDY